MVLSDSKESISLPAMNIHRCSPRVLFVSLVLGILVSSHVPLNSQTSQWDVCAEFLVTLNTMRANPQGFLPHIDAYKRQIASFTKNKKALNTAVAEIKSILTKLKPLPPLGYDTLLAKAATRHMLDGAQWGFVGHIGSDSSNPATRAAAYGVYSEISEAITYGTLSTSLMLAAFLVDEGTPSRGHRTAILSKTYTRVGLAYGTHPLYTNQLVVLLAN